MAEVSKKRGEFGEKLVEKLLELLGWTEILRGRDIPCIAPFRHNISTNGRVLHGVDFIYEYECPLFNQTQEFILISSKFNNKYTSNPTSKFKSHMQDVIYALECFKKSDLKNNLSNFNLIHKKYTGVIFWLDNGEGVPYDDVINRLDSFRIPNNWEFDSVYLVDNKRANFLYDTLTFAHNQFPESILEFLVPNTGHNNTIGTRKTSSKILPVQYINSSILPLKIIQGSTEILALNIIDDFEADYLKGLITLAQKLTEGWGSHIYIFFPQYNPDLHDPIVEEIKLSFRDKTFIQKIEVGTFKPNFRNA